MATAGLCASATNTYSSTVIVTLTNPTAGTLTITHGGQTQTLLTTSATTTLTATFDNLISDGNSHTVLVSLPGCSTTSASYTAPTSCRVELGLAITDPGVCLPGTNTYNTTGVISLTNAVPGTATITDGTSTTTIAISAGATSVPYSLTGLPSGTGSHTVTVSYLGQTASTTYTAPASCSIAPVCSLSATATAGLCATATNTYSASIVVSLTNTTAGMITISLPGTTPVSQTLAANTPTFTAVFQDLPSDGATHTATISLPGCGTTTATYTAPVSCSVAPVCSISAVATPGLCQSATNTFTNTVVVSLTNPQTGILTVTDGPASLTFAAVAGSSGSFTATFAGISSTGASHTVTTSLPGCSTISTTYTAPVSCSLAPVCSLSATATAGLCATATNTYSATAVIQLTNPTAGVLTVTAGVQSATFVTTTAPSATFTVVFPGLLSDGATHTITASLPSCSSITATYTAPTSCSVAPVCSISAVVTPGLCQIATNTFTTVALINITNPTTGILTVSDGPASLTFATVAGGSASFTATLANIISDGASHTLTATLPGCSTTSTTYTAPASCSIAPPVCSLSAVATAGLCSTATNTYSSTVVITLTNPTAGTLTVTNGGQTQTLLTTSATTTLTATFDNLISDGNSHTVVVSLPGCSTASTTYTAPTSCRVEVGLAITDPGVCLPGTNTYNTTGLSV
ncbi:hypothetical protein GO730_19080 [Spirosoma sp. HMF3257]|uniref:Uncharacterized protein n=1 Tax=Spirosoma telluris TaxID=2183553 RepID=A0A327NKL9_9BACT|nr:hypothetical protein [Spirosoma telluris]RAI75722.1 hypothetical protein HMF3257_19005 [Spirosoma telluris]